MTEEWCNNQFETWAKNTICPYTYMSVFEIIQGTAQVTQETVCLEFLADLKTMNKLEFDSSLRIELRELIEKYEEKIK